MADRPLPRAYTLESGEGFVRIVERFWRPARVVRLLIMGVGSLVAAPAVELGLESVCRDHGVEALIGAVFLLIVAIYVLAAWTLDVVTVELDGTSLRRSSGPLPLFSSWAMPLSNVLMFAANYEISRSDDEQGGSVPRTLGELRARPFGGKFSGARVVWTVYVESKDGFRDPLFDNVGDEDDAYGLRDALRELIRA